jgi:hypothetical protein
MANLWLTDDNSDCTKVTSCGPTCQYGMYVTFCSALPRWVHHDTDCWALYSVHRPVSWSPTHTRWAISERISSFHFNFESPRFRLDLPFATDFRNKTQLVIIFRSLKLTDDWCDALFKNIIFDYVHFRLLKPLRFETLSCFSLHVKRIRNKTYSM